MRRLAHAWGVLTSMRTALVLLLALGVVAVPGSLLPQDPLDPDGVARWYLDHPRIAPVVDALGGFDVYSSPIFLALYVALGTSLLGCIGPRLRHHWRALRAAPPRVPRRLDRLPAFTTATTTKDAAATADAAADLLRRRHWRVARSSTDGAAAVSAEKGYLHETGNLAFHLSLLLLLGAVGFGWLQRFEGRVLLVEGEEVTHSRLAYDGPPRVGELTSVEDVPPFTLRLEDFEATFTEEGVPSSFRADVRWTEGEDTRDVAVRVNHPLRSRGTNVHLLDHGYAARLVVKDRDGTVLADDRTPAFGRDGLAPQAVVKVADVPAGRPQVGLVASVLPTLELTDDGRPFSSRPELRNPAVVVEVFAGDLNLDVPQRVSELITTDLVPTSTLLLLPDAQPAPLPGGLTVELAGVSEWASFQVSRDPGRVWVLVSAVLLVAGLAASLLVRRRRIWVRARAEGGTTLVEVAGLGRGRDEAVRAELDRLAPELVPGLVERSGSVRVPEPVGAADEEERA
jgi:cytochrome c biogenesis protein